MNASMVELFCGLVAKKYTYIFNIRSVLSHVEQGLARANIPGSTPGLINLCVYHI